MQFKASRWSVLLRLFFALDSRTHHNRGYGMTHSEFHDHAESLTDGYSEK